MSNGQKIIAGMQDAVNYADGKGGGRIATAGEYELVKMKQNRGPMLRFMGKLLADEEFTTRGRDPLLIVMEIWQTEGGAFVACTKSWPAEREDGHRDQRATVVEPIIKDDGDYTGDPADLIDEQAMRFAVMQHFEWEARARSMVKKQLGWNLTQEVA